MKRQQKNYSDNLVKEERKVREGSSRGIWSIARIAMLTAAVLFVFGLGKMRTYAADDTTWQEDYEYTLDPENGIIQLTQYKEGAPGGDIVIPTTAVIGEKEYKTYFGGPKFFPENNITSFTTEEGVVMTDAKMLFYFKGEKTEEDSFETRDKLISVDLSNVDASKTTSMFFMFGYCDSLETVKFGQIDTSNVTDMSLMFGFCRFLVECGVENLDTGNVETMNQMFNNCQALEKLDLSNFDTSKVSDMTSMFNFCYSLKELDLSSFDLSNIASKEEYGLFSAKLPGFIGCKSLCLLKTPKKLPSFDTESELVVELPFEMYEKKTDGTMWESGYTNLLEAPEVCELITKDYIKTVTMLRLYNPNSGEHFYTSSEKEKKTLEKAGWNFEGVAWEGPSWSATPVYRLYNPNVGEHHYTPSEKERDKLVKLGWKDEGIGWYSDDKKGTPLYRLYNPNATTGNHHYTTSKKERDKLVKIGWNDEGIGWYGY